MNKFVKADLRTGNVVALRNGIMAIVLLNTKFGDVVKATKIDAIGMLNEYRNDMTDVFNRKDYDIVKVFQPINTNQLLESFIKSKGSYRLVWERKDVEEISLEHALKVLKEHYGCAVKIKE